MYEVNFDHEFDCTSCFRQMHLWLNASTTGSWSLGNMLLLQFQLPEIPPELVSVDFVDRLALECTSKR